MSSFDDDKPPTLSERLEYLLMAVLVVGAFVAGLWGAIRWLLCG